MELKKYEEVVEPKPARWTTKAECNYIDKLGTLRPRQQVRTHRQLFQLLDTYIKTLEHRTFEDHVDVKAIREHAEHRLTQVRMG